MNEHESIREMLALEASGVLDPMESRRVQQHLNGCESCRQDLHNWGLYTQGLRQLPRPPAPDGLVERTQALMANKLETAASHRRNALTLAGLALFGWAISLSLWISVRVFTGGAFSVSESLANAGLWSLASSVVAWITAGTAAVVLGKRRVVRGFYEPIS